MWLCFKGPLQLGSSLVSKLLVKSKFDPLNVMAKFNSWPKFQVHALLNGGQGQQQQCLAINFLVEEYSCQWCTVSRFEESHNVSHAPFQRVTVQLQLFSNFNLYLLDKPPGTKRTKILQKAWTPLLASTPDVQLPNEAVMRAPNCTYSVVKRCADSTVLQVEVTSSQPVSSDLKPGLGTAEVEPRMANSWEVESSPFCLQLSV